MSQYDFPEDEPGFFQKYGFAIGLGVMLLVVAGLGAGVYFFTGKIPPPKKPEEIVVHLQPPPPLPPPPPPPPPPEQKFVEQPKDLKPLEKPKDEPKNPD